MRRNQQQKLLPLCSGNRQVEHLLNRQCCPYWQKRFCSPGENLSPWWHAAWSFWPNNQNLVNMVSAFIFSLQFLFCLLEKYHSWLWRIEQQTGRFSIWPLRKHLDNSEPIFSSNGTCTFKLHCFAKYECSSCGYFFWTWELQQACSLQCHQQHLATDNLCQCQFVSF